MRLDLGDRLRLTVLGCSTAAPHVASPAAGYLVEWAGTSILLDAGQGVVRRLARLLDPTGLDALIVGHMHADHYLDIVGLRYLFPWGETAPRRLPVHLPPGARQSIEALERAVSERPGFFEAAFDISEYEPTTPLRIGDLTVRFIRGRHYIPAWGVVVEAPDGSRLAYTGDTGPSDEVVQAVRGADLLLVEGALHQRELDALERGHLTPEEAIEVGRDAGARATLIVHYPPGRLEEIAAMCAGAGIDVKPAVAGLTVTVSPGANPAVSAVGERSEASGLS